MHRHFNFFLRLSLVFSLLVSSVRAATTIMVDFGPHRSAQEAGHNEAKVNWNDGDFADDTVCTTCFSALELQHYLRLATEKTDDFEIMDDDAVLPDGDLLLVGSPASNAASRRLLVDLKIEANQLSELGSQEYCLKSKVIGGRRITLLAGGSRQGTLYAVYDYLHRLGCRWFAPGGENEEIPHVEALPEIDVFQRPSFVMRGFHGYHDRGTPDFLLWMARNRMNYWSVEQSNHPFLRKIGLKLEGGGHAVASLLKHDRNYPYAHPHFAASAKKPADPYPLSPEFLGDANGDGRLSYSEAHPEWFGLKRDSSLTNRRAVFGKMNYCTSNPHATAEFMKNILQALIKGDYREADILRFWMIDVGNWCECDVCQALGSPTDRNFLLVNRLIQEIKKARAEGRLHREVFLRFLAYMDVLDPPSRPLPDDFDYQTAMATFYPIKRCYVHNFDDASCSTNAALCRQLHGWAVDPARHYRGALCIGEYYNVSRFRNLPICFMQTMSNDIPYYHRQGARSFEYMHATTEDWGSKALTNYQMARQSWDVKTDCQALWTDYFSRRYGPAAPVMRDFYENLEKMLCNMNVIKYDFAPRLNRGDKELFRDSHFCYQPEPNKKCLGPSLLEMAEYGRQCRNLIDDALKMPLPPRIAARLAEDERGFTYGERTIGYYLACVEAFQLGREGKLAEARHRQREAVRLAKLLEVDRRSVKFSYDVKTRNALEASLAPDAVNQLEKLLGPAEKTGTSMP